MTDFWNNIFEEEIPEDEDPNKMNTVVEKILNFRKQQNLRELEILTPKKMLQRLPIALV